MATYVIETYLSRSRAFEFDAATRQLREAVSAVSTVARPARHVRSFFVPEDETCFHVVESASIDVAVDVARRAGLNPDRIVEAELPVG